MAPTTFEAFMRVPAFRQLSRAGGAGLMATDENYRSSPGEVYESLGVGASPGCTRRRRGIPVSRRTYFERMAAGICASCCGPKEPGACRCAACAKKQREGKARYKRGLWAPNPDRVAAKDQTPRCRCGLRLSTTDELTQGQCSGCIPSSREMAERRRAWD